MKFSILLTLVKDKIANLFVSLTPNLFDYCIMKGIIGELLGTFILTFLGCSSVAVCVLFGEYNSIFQIGLVWGITVTLVVFLTRNICYAHLNPAVSVAMVVAGRMKLKLLPGYLLGQFLGAMLAGAMLYVLFSPSIAQYEMAHGIVRGTADSVDTARMFGEFYPNPADAMSTVSLPLAMLAEGFGTMIKEVALSVRPSK